jgi:hypothetical protein
MSQPLTCPHSSIGLCVPCYHERIAAGVEMPDESTECDPDVCMCGRIMNMVWRGRSDGVVVNWCAGCGVVHVHQPDGWDDTRHIPNPKYIGQR